VKRNPFIIPTSRFDKPSYLENRAVQAPKAARSALGKTLRYLYITDGPINLSRDYLRTAERYLDPGERTVVRWLQHRTNNRLRATYGPPALRCARRNRYRCQVCGYADVRALNLDHVEGRVANATFACLCANCHSIKSRKHDWTGRKRLNVLTQRVESFDHSD
jgi:hypothetical protein